jgi:multiple antibiotic resistance protein
VAAESVGTAAAFGSAMAAEWGMGLSFFVTLFSVLNPVHAVPLYLAMVGRPTPETNRRVASLASLTVLVALMVALLAGERLLELFGITIFAFQVGGGVLILMMAMSMLQGQVSPAKSTPEETEEAAHWNSIAVVPLGIPILAGAGSLSTVVVFAHHAHGWEQWTTLVAGILANSGLTYVFLALSTRLYQWLGQTGVNVVSRLMGMILVAMAVQFMANGIAGLFPGLTAPH